MIKLEYILILVQSFLLHFFFNMLSLNLKIFFIFLIYYDSSYLRKNRFVIKIEFIYLLTHFIRNIYKKKIVN
jgi:hypothetical protein